jgi:protein-S-isoprenylcysteine O-methyltransferase Ste14
MNIFEQWGWRWTSWQKGERGEYWFLAQLLGFMIFALLPQHPIWMPRPLPPLVQGGLTGIAVVLICLGLVFMGKGLLDLGKSLTPLPYPREDGELVTTGLYGIVRHPLYSGIMLATAGWVIFTLSWPHALGWLALALLLERKATQEERWLVQKYPDYEAYRQRVKKLIPGLW